MKAKNILMVLVTLFPLCAYAAGPVRVDSIVSTPLVHSKNISASIQIENAPMSPSKFREMVAGKTYRIFKPAFVFEQACPSVISDRGVNYCKLPTGYNQADIFIQFAADGNTALMNGYMFYYAGQVIADYYDYHYSDNYKPLDITRYNANAYFTKNAQAAKFDPVTGFAPKITFNNRLISFRDPFPSSAYVAPADSQGYNSWAMQEYRALWGTPSIYQSNITLFCGSGAPSRVDNSLCASGYQVSGEDLNILDQGTVELKVWGANNDFGLSLLGRLQ